MRLFLIIFIVGYNIYAQTDSLLSAEDNEDLLPSVPNENLSYDYLEDQNNLSFHLRNRYLSHPSLSPKIYNKLQGELSNIYAGVITEKDAGENMLTDFYSYYAGYKDTGFIQNIIAGNYSMYFGCGLVSGNLYNSYKTSDPFFPISKNNTRISPYRSTDENKFYRGGALTLKLSKIYFTAFYSDVRGTPGLPIINGSKSSGVITEYNNSNLLFSLLFSIYNTAKASTESNKQRNKFISLFAKVPLNENVSIQTETASDFLYSSSISIITLRASKQLNFLSSVRVYNRRFHSLYGSAFGEQYGSDYNETGFYNGISFSIKGLSIDLIYDQYKLSGQKDYSGNELMIKGSCNVTRASSVKLKYSSRFKEYSPAPFYDKRSFSVEYLLKISRNFIYKVKGEYVKSGKSEEGFMFYNELRYREGSFSSDFRLASFKSTSFESALYVYEKDLPGLFTSRILTGEGLRWYICSSYKFLENLNISFKFSAVIKRNDFINYLGLQSDLEI